MYFVCVLRYNVSLYINCYMMMVVAFIGVTTRQFGLHFMDRCLGVCDKHMSFLGIIIATTLSETN